MVSYSFDKRFVVPILSGAKKQTMRSPRRNQVQAGGTVHLFTGLRTKHVRRLGNASCIGTAPIRLDLQAGRVEYTNTGTTWTTPEQLHSFAVGDGFADWNALVAFWAKEHPGVPQWEGDIIRWTNFIPFEEPPHD